MSEPSISLTYDTLKTRVGYFSNDTGASATAVQWGYQKFLAAHEWTFLTKTASLTVVAEDVTTALPDDFGGLVDGFYDATNQRVITDKVSSDELLRRSALYGYEDYPRWFAIEPSAFTATTGQRWVVRWNPSWSAGATLSYRYKAIPNQLADGHYPMGGPLHSLTILYAALAAWEELYQTPAKFSQLYEIELQKSIRLDNSFRAGTVHSSSESLPSNYINQSLLE